MKTLGVMNFVKVLFLFLANEKLSFVIHSNRIWQKCAVSGLARAHRRLVCFAARADKQHLPIGTDESPSPPPPSLPLPLPLLGAAASALLMLPPWLRQHTKCQDKNCGVSPASVTTKTVNIDHHNFITYVTIFST